ncbi:hypothetical protein [Flavobacterium sp.]|uniref:hypothetical protein n=1 Tax=Flavobacterium sp. TaxID=239 RepID=UPI00403412C1
MNHRISIPKPCHEDWNAMTPNEQGRFCGQCSKTVTDFTGMGALEIQNYLLENNGTKVCGRFKSTQLDTINITIPERVLYTQTKFRNVFLLALLVTMGTMLFSCKDKSQTIGEISIVKDSIEVDSTNSARQQMHTLGMPSPDDSLPPQPRSKTCGPVTGKEIHLTGAVIVNPPPPELSDIILGEPAVPVANPVSGKDSDSIK